MNGAHAMRGLIIALTALILCGARGAGAQGYDVPFVPSPQVVVDEMLRMANVGPDDFVIDLGSGDGRMLITAARKFGARGLGVDLDPHLVFQAEESARQAGVEGRVTFLEQDLFKTDISKADVVTMYLLPGVNMRLRPRLLDLKPGTRIVAHDFDLGDWKPDRRTTIRKNVFLWIVPAKIGGRWRLTVPLEGGERTLDVELRQRHQEIDGLARVDGAVWPLWETQLTGDRIRFVAVDASDRESEASLYFDGRVTGDVMEGEVRRGVGRAEARLRWRAVRSGSL